MEALLAAVKIFLGLVRQAIEAADAGFPAATKAEEDHLLQHYAKESVQSGCHAVWVVKAVVRLCLTQATEKHLHWSEHSVWEEAEAA